MVKLHGAVLPKLTTFPTNPTEGRLAFVDDVLYVFSNVDGSINTWYPLSNRTERYIHTQSSTSTSWNVQHDLESEDLEIFCYDGSDDEITPTDITYVDSNNVTITFASTQIGSCAIFVDVNKKLEAISSFSLPDQTGNSGKVLGTDGSDPSWVNSGTGGAITGEIRTFPFSSIPTGWLECDGSSLDRTTYAELYAEIGVQYGNVDGTHFNIPDYRGKFLRSWAHGSANDPDRASRTDRGDSTTGDNVGTSQGQQIVSHNHNYNTGPRTNPWAAPNQCLSYQYQSTATITGVTQTKGGNETRPININVLVCIKY